MVSSFSVVEFVDEVDPDGCKKMDIIPIEWFKGTDRKVCWWPPASLVNVTKAVKEHTPPASNWIVCNVRAMGNAATYAEARVKLHQAEYSSDLTDTENISRKRRPSAKLLQSQLSTQLESSEHSDSSEELPPTPPSQHLWPAVKEVSNYFQNPIARGVTSPTARGVTSPTATITSPTAQGVTSPTARGVTSPTARGVTSPTARGFTSPIAEGVTSPTARGVTSPTARGVTSPTARGVTSPTAEGVTSPTARGVTSPTARGVTSPTAEGVTSPTARGVTSPTAQGVASPTCEAMFTKLLTVLEEVKETQRVHGKMLNALLKKQDGSVLEVPEGVVLPLKTQADLEALDQKLGDRSVMSAVVTMVADVGGTSIDDATRRMMKYILSNELALEYNLFGRHGKKKFKDLCLFNVVYEALKNNPLTSKVNLQEAERALSKWFTGARDRGGQRAARMHQKLAVA
ncbi:glutamate--tRNA ligase-like [Megalobrama amblycephala]|uniref:glutamate--tRNA ligase-like n=1 Tax=Megalobrama amblycephala TaxID=75352 RepID=UPI00201473E9|nr:glutamate--tRNA ligase-like [Megalobrama amblycephala]